MFPSLTNQNLTSGYKEHFIKLVITVIGFTTGLRITDNPKSQSKNEINPYVLGLMLK